METVGGKQGIDSGGGCPAAEGSWGLLLLDVLLQEAAWVGTGKPLAGPLGLYSINSSIVLEAQRRKSHHSLVSMDEFPAFLTPYLPEPECRMSTEGMITTGLRVFGQLDGK